MKERGQKKPADLGVCGERRVSSHEEVQAWCGDEGGNQANQVVVHVARVPQGGGAGGHHCRHLHTEAHAWQSKWSQRRKAKIPEK